MDSVQVHVHSGLFLSHKEVGNNAPESASGKTVEMIIPSEVGDEERQKYQIMISLLAIN